MTDLKADLVGTVRRDEYGDVWVLTADGLWKLVAYGNGGINTVDDASVLGVSEVIGVVPGTAAAEPEGDRDEH